MSYQATLRNLLSTWQVIIVMGVLLLGVRGCVCVCVCVGVGVCGWVGGCVCVWVGGWVGGGVYVCVGGGGCRPPRWGGGVHHTWSGNVLRSMLCVGGWSDPFRNFTTLHHSHTRRPRL